MTKAQLDRHLEDAADQTFAAFYRRELPGQVRRAALLIGDTAANDIVHDAFVMLYQRWDLVDSPGPYLQRTVLNGCRDRARREARLRRLLPRLVERQVVADHATVWDIINALPFNQRAVVVLKVLRLADRSRDRLGSELPDGFGGTMAHPSVAIDEKGPRMNDGFEQRIVDALHSHATHVQVADRLDAIVDQPGTLRRLSPMQQRLSFIAAACMIAAIAGAGLRTATGAIPRPNVAASGGQAEERPTPVTTWTDDQFREGAAAWIAILDGGGRASIDGGLDASVIVERLDTRCEAKAPEPALHEPPFSLASAEVAEAMSLVLGAVLCEVSTMSVHISADGSLAGVIATTSADKVREIQSLIGPHVDVQLDGAS